jgi:exosortase/archaeosortase
MYEFCRDTIQCIVDMMKHCYSNSQDKFIHLHYSLWMLIMQCTRTEAVAWFYGLLVSAKQKLRRGHR